MGGDLWQHFAFGDLVEHAIGGGWGLERATADHTRVAVVRGTDLDDARAGVVTNVPVRFEASSKVPQRELRENDIIFEASGGSQKSRQHTGRALLVRSALLSAFDCPVIPASFCKLIRLRGDRAHAPFLYYWLKDFRDSHRIERYEQPSTGIINFQFGFFERDALVHLPPLDEQRRIAAVLGALDDKIELNRKMNRTLEEMAQAIFKSWFIDFDGHDDLVDSEIGPVPRGWEVRSLDAIADFLNGAACQKYPATDGEPWLPVIKIRELNQGVTAQTDRATATIPDKWHVRDGDVLFSWSGSLVVKVWTGGPGALNQHLFKVTSEACPRWFYLSWLQHHLAEFQRIAADKATTMGHIKRHHLNDAKCAVPPADVLAKIGALLEPVVNRQVANELESRTLAELRDTLLPKLISGELRVPEAEDAVGPAAGPRSPSAAGEARLP